MIDKIVGHWRLISIYSLCLLLRGDMCQLVSTGNSLDLQLTSKLRAIVTKPLYLNPFACMHWPKEMYEQEFEM